MSGGNFWKGAAQAGIIAGFNHAAHALDERAAARLQKRILADGKLSYAEANSWYRKGGGRELTVDASKIDLTWVSDDMWQSDGSKYVETLLRPDGLVHGGITIRRLSSQLATIDRGLYEFEQHGPYFSEPWRNTFTKIGLGMATVFGTFSGSPYMINYRGSTKINQFKPFYPYY